LRYEFGRLIGLIEGRLKVKGKRIKVEDLGGLEAGKLWY
jgi:hypothetical protein